MNPGVSHLLLLLLSTAFTLFSHVLTYGGSGCYTWLFFYVAQSVYFKYCTDDRTKHTKFFDRVSEVLQNVVKRLVLQPTCHKTYESVGVLCGWLPATPGVVPTPIQNLQFFGRVLEVLQNVAKRRVLYYGGRITKPTKVQYPHPTR